MEIDDYIINIGPNGTFKPSGKYFTTPEKVDNIFNRLEKEKAKKITIYFHGGLINEDAGLEIGAKIANHLLPLGQTPICLAWETGLMETFTSNLSKIRETKVFGKLVKILIKSLSGRLGFTFAEGRGIGSSLSDSEIETELTKDRPFEDYTNEKFEASGRGPVLSGQSPTLKNLEDEFYFEVNSDKKLIKDLEETKFTKTESRGTQSRGIISTAILVKSVASIAFRVIKRFLNKRDHDFYPTIIEELLRELYIAELGAWVWGSMKSKSSEMWQNNDGLNGLEQHAGRYLLDKLNQHKKKFNDVEINLVGHSAGSIAVCNLLRVSSESHPSLSYNKIIFMAPACRIDLFHDEVVKQKTRYKKFRMFTMYNKYEVLDTLVPYVYTHSLLYLISGILENDGNDFDCYILGLERYFSGNSPYNSDEKVINTKKFLFEQGENRIVFSQTEAGAAQGFRSKSLTHGGFDDDEVEEGTIPSIKYFLGET